MKYYRFLIFFYFAAMPVFLFAESIPQEMSISSKGEVVLFGVEVVHKYAVNYAALSVWGQKWDALADEFTKFEAADGTKITAEEIVRGHILEVKGKIVKEKQWFIEANIIRDLSIRSLPTTPVASLFLSLKPYESVQPSIESIKKESLPTVVLKSIADEKIPSKLTNHLQLGMHNGEVRLLQEFLQKNKWGIPDDGPVTGYFGTVTQKALIKFQESNGLEGAGTVGPQTRALINLLLNEKAASTGNTETISSNREITVGMRGKDVIVVQEFLQKNKWGIPDDGPVTGYFGLVSVKAVKKFQKSVGLPETGTVDLQTRQAMSLP